MQESISVSGLHNSTELLISGGKKKFTIPVLLQSFKLSQSFYSQSLQGYWEHVCNFYSFRSYKIHICLERGPFTESQSLCHKDTQENNSQLLVGKLI